MKKQIAVTCNTGTPTDDSLLAAYHQPHFSDGATLLQANGINLPATQIEADAYREAMNIRISANYDSTCRAYASQWLESLKNCSYNEAAKDTIVNRLVLVCRNGSDESHPFGSSTTGPTSIYQYHSFEEVIDQYNVSNGISASSACNADLIIAPRPYNQQTIYSEKPVWTRPDSCECSRINVLHDQYRLDSAAYSGFSDYMLMKFQTNISDSVLTALLELCAPVGPSCNYLKTPIALPAVLQCYSGEICVSCRQVDSVFNLYKNKYPAAAPVKTPADSLQRAYNSLFTGYLNTKLGFSKTAAEYLDFLDSCQIELPDSLYILKKNFKQYIDTLQPGAAECDTTDWAISPEPIFIGAPPSWLESIQDGILTFPSRITSNPGHIHYRYMKPLTIPPGGLSIETRLKLPLLDSNCNFPNFQFQLRPEGGWVNALFLQKSIPCNRTSGAFDLADSTHPGHVITDQPKMAIEMTDWVKIKITILQGKYRIYVADTLLLEMPYSGTLTKLNSFNLFFGTSTSYSKAVPYVDYVKVYNGCNEVAYNNEFNYPGEQVCPDLSIRYAPDDFKTVFTNYYNQTRNTDYSIEEIDSLYTAHNVPLYDCDNATDSFPDRLLCGNAVPVIAPVDVASFITNCSDSSFFIYSNATELYKVYTDSLMGEFDNRYRVKCLQAYKYENFTVTHQVSEFHYTLYYYDQAGNLLKTIPPKGVNPNRGTTWLNEVKVKRASGETQLPGHTMATGYRYNTLNQVMAQQTPDAGKSEFWYDRLGRLAISQNAMQKAVSATAANRLYSYTKYDVLGRITEVGQVKDNTGSTTVNAALTRNQSTLDSWLTARDNYRGQITSTIYDQPYDGFAGFDTRLIVQQRNLRNRVSFTNFSDTANGTAFNQATYYSYDIHGNVDTLLQDYGVTTQYPNLMNTNGNRYKKLVYNYDLISGKVNKVSYQPGWSDQVFHKYNYDAENRLTVVETSFDDRTWEKEAGYEYYRHGPLARMVLGQQQVQGIDYAYTLQGWLKGVNSTKLFSSADMGGDGLSGGLNQLTARDAIGFNLNYYDTSDYSAISAIDPFPGTMAGLSGNYHPLFNGNISSMAVNNRALNNANVVGGALMLYNYTYDQLNRLTRMDAYNGFNTTTDSWSGMTQMDQFKERIAYDANGNIGTYLRHGHKSSFVMDDLTYSYGTGTNRLLRVTDNVPDASYGLAAGDVADMDNQGANNYTYDEIGNLVKDVKEGLTNVKWSVYGKILEITRTANAANPVQRITYTYDAQGSRISKTVLKNTGNKTHTWYVRDAQGNVMCTYISQGNPSDLATLRLDLSEQHLYGSSRLGISSRTVNVDNGPKDMKDSAAVKYYRGLRQYELSNHLGNVLATISDKKKGHVDGGGAIDYYDADITTAQDYYPFGMLMPGRIGYQSSAGWVTGPDVVSPDHSLAADVAIDMRTDNQPPEYTATRSVEMISGFESGSGDTFLAYISEADEGGDEGGGSSGGSLNGSYRYGFNGKENDDEVKGEGNQQDYGMRIYDPRLGRFLSVDPLTKDYPELTPYQFASNTPIQAIDIDGEEGGYSMDSENEKLKRQGEAVLRQLDYRNNPLSRYQSNPHSLSAVNQPKNEYEQNRLLAVEKREFDKAGRNPDGTQKPLTKLANNKTWNSFANNLALPMLEGYSYASGLGELRAIYRGLSYLGKREFGALAKTGTINPNSIRFSQNNISETFKKGEDVQSLINVLKSGKQVNIEPIRIVEKEGMVFSLDNRRLYAYQQAGVEIPYIKLDKIPKEELRKFTTTNTGTSVEVRTQKPSN